MSASLGYQPNGSNLYGVTGQPTFVPSSQQVVIPQITIPQPFQTNQQFQQPVIQGPQLYRVKGMDGAKRFQTVANACYALFDEDEDVMYIKETDGNNYPSIRRFVFSEEDEPAPAPPPEYVTVEDFNKFKEEILNAKQPVRSKTGKSTGGDAAE